MTELEKIDAPTILGITEQQLNLLKAVYKLTSKNKPVTPKEIEATYATSAPGGIHKSNLFRQLKILQDKSLLAKEGEANYKINFDGIKNTLDTRKQDFLKKLDQYTELSEEIEEYFRRVSSRDRIPVVEYLDYNELFVKVMSSIRKANKYYITSKFPGVIYTYSPYRNVGRGEYMQMLMQRCFEKRDLEITYLTRLDLDYPLTHSMSIYKDKSKAIRECEIIIDQLENLVEIHESLKILHLENPYGLDVIIPEGKELNESYLFIRDDHMDVQGGIHIKSEETAKRSKETFLNLCSNANEVKGAYAKKICNDLRKELKNMGKRSGKTIPVKK